MRTIKLNKIILLALGLVVFNACVQDDDFDTPNTVVTDPVINEDNIVDIDAVIGNLLQSGEDIITFEDTDDIMEGYVISSDEGGNFFEELVLQDKPENPTAGIVVQIDVNPLYTIYDFGRKVYVKLDGLSVAIDNGVVQIGRRDGNDLEKISSSAMEETVLRTSEVATIVPLEVSITEFSDDFENLYVRLTDVQFEAGDVLGENPKTFAAEDEDDFDGERDLISCVSGSSVIFSTSTFADFKSLLLPANRGTVDGVLSRDFFDNDYIIVVNSPEAINFDNDQRCDPVFEENFSSAVDNTTLNIDGWINYAEEGGELWTEQVFNSNGYAEFSAFSTGDSSNIGWLISPGIDMDAQSGEVLTFQTEHAFPDAGHDPLEVLISTDFDGTEAGIATATWEPLSFDVSYIVDFDTWYNFTDSGPIDLSSYTGTAYIAFRYTGSDTANENMTLHVDNVNINVP